MLNEFMNIMLRLELLLTEILSVAKLYQGQHSPDKWLDSCDIKAMFHISRTTLYRLKKRNILVPSCLGGKEFYLQSEVEKVLRKGK